ncbi:MAG: cell division protein ZapE [Pseudomonadales bacterium]
MTPREHYQKDLAKPGFEHDPAQARVVDLLDDLHHRLLSAEAPSRWRRFRERLSGEAAPPVRGIYLWGSVGSGKTYLMDMFFECLPIEAKLRLHFHRFMRRVHRELTRLAGEVNPLSHVGAGLAREARVLCFDEFFVSDIGDAMILAELVEELFRRGVTLVTTSNVHPTNLYENGLQWRRFMPAISLLERHTDVVHLTARMDYRLRALERAEIYHWPLDAEADRILERSFESLMPEAPSAGEVLQIEGRPIRTRFTADDVVWFDFPQICDGPRSQNDDIELARCFHAVLISNVPRFSRETDDQARRFISLVDEFYDRNVKLILSAEVRAEELYCGEHLGAEFNRTSSRLIEMQTHEYLGRVHRA